MRGQCQWCPFGTGRVALSPSGILWTPKLWKKQVPCAPTLWAPGAGICLTVYPLLPCLVSYFREFSLQSFVLNWLRFLLLWAVLLVLWSFWEIANTLFTVSSCAAIHVVTPWSREVLLEHVSTPTHSSVPFSPFAVHGFSMSRWHDVIQSQQICH